MPSNHLSPSTLSCLSDQNTRILRFGVIGNPIAHSLSPLIHQRFAAISGQVIDYQKIIATPLSFADTVSSFFEQGGAGLNITAPFKENAFELAPVKKHRAFEAKAANTLWMQDGQLCADNTDGIGFLQDLRRFFSLNQKKILMLGTGGATRGLIPILIEANVSQVTVAGRNPEKGVLLQHTYPCINFKTLDLLTDKFDLIINAIPTADFVPDKILSHLHLSEDIYCYDLNYVSPCSETRFVQWAKARGCQARNGLGMLIQQAAEAYFIWHGIKPPTEGIFDDA